MRSFDRSMPEELNRVLADHASSLLLCSSEVAVANLRHEGVAGLVELVGDVMVDVAIEASSRGRASAIDLVRARGVEPGEYVLATAHRAGNVDDPGAAGAAGRAAAARCRSRCCCRCIRARDARLRRAGLLERLQRRSRGDADRAARATSS